MAVLLLATYNGIAQTEDSTFKLREVTVSTRWKNDTDRYKYNQMKYYVTTVMPYVNATTLLMQDINAKKHEPGASKKDRKRYIGQREDEMRDQFEGQIKKLNTTQGALLVKLIARQTNMNIYKMLLDFKNPLVAIKWQTWARLNGMNLDKKYHPEDERTLENIMYDLGYPLPDSYAVNK